MADLIISIARSILRHDSRAIVREDDLGSDSDRSFSLFERFNEFYGNFLRSIQRSANSSRASPTI